MKKISVLLTLILATSASPLFSQQTSMKASPKPVSMSVVGDSLASYPVTTYPIFGASTSDNEACANSLRASLSGAQRGGRPAPQTILKKVVAFKNLGLSGYKKSSKIIISWTARIEAQKGPAINPWTNSPRLCNPWHGTIESIFPGGDVDLMLYVDGRMVGKKASMTFPSLGKGSSTNVSDPTISNSVTLEAADFAGSIPDSFTIELKWVNKTIGSSISSAGSYRNMTILIIPSI